MKQVKIAKLRVENYSTIISNREIYECIKILPSEYRKINSHIFIHENNKRYFWFCFKKLRLLAIHKRIMNGLIQKFRRDSIGEGVYIIGRNEIHLFEGKMRTSIQLVKKQAMKSDKSKYITEKIWKKYEHMWIKYKMIYALIHELNHAIQDTKGKINPKIFEKTIKWEKRKYEIDSVKKSECIYAKYGKRISEILKADGISAYHIYEPELGVGFSYEIEIDDNLT